jgi:hypothetical protein
VYADLLEAAGPERKASLSTCGITLVFFIKIQITLPPWLHHGLVASGLSQFACIYVLKHIWIHTNLVESETTNLRRREYLNST